MVLTLKQLFSPLIYKLKGTLVKISKLKKGRKRKREWGLDKYAKLKKETNKKRKKYKYK